MSNDDRVNFVRQMDALHRGANVVPASYRGELPSRKKCVAITFDDAFCSVAENALPELAKRSFHSTIFVPVGWLGRTPGWVMEDEPSEAVKGSAKLAEVVMSPEQLKSLNIALVALGSHTITHPSMLELDRKRARTEIEDSRNHLSELTGREIHDFSFPYGVHDASTIAMCRRAGYESVYSIAPQDVDTTSSVLLRGRTKVDPSDGPIEFFLKFNGAYQWMEAPLGAKLRSLLRQRTVAKY
jgi:peptidoglycan/xylan/chitin deacetylase (PgdA/CDA1 family)